MSKDKRNEHLQANGTSIVDFLPERPYEMGCGDRAIPRRGTSDFTVLFMSIEPKVVSHLVMKENETFVDVGANVGVYTLMVAKKYMDKGVTVVAIEGHPENHKALCRNIECNDDRFEDIIRPINKAVPNHKGIVTMFQRSADGKRVGTSLYSLYDTYIHDGNYVKPDGQALELECDTLDNILAGHKADVMHMDIEGAEVLALNGATNTLKCLRKIVVEIHANNLGPIKRLLQINGFETEIINEAMTYITGSKC